MLWSRALLTSRACLRTHAIWSAGKLTVLRRKPTLLIRSLCVSPPSPSPSQGQAAPKAEKRDVWHEQSNAQGRVYYLNTHTGDRSWERPDPSQALVKSIAEVEAEEAIQREMEDRRQRLLKKPYQGDSLMMRMVDNFWRLADLVRKGYWLGIVVGAFYMLSELYKDFMM
mmetsp:Transcript_21580/g.42381  ORF Transcript_21580/g.42381 Transcript_21580/m.42381 type:complete len:169 (-) Transcript_21580:1158-1664(-)